MFVLAPKLTTGGVDYRTTFLRHHVAEQLQHTDDVLAVKELIDKYDPSQDDTRIRDLLSLETFFYRSYSGERLWLPVQIIPAPSPDNGEPVQIPSRWDRRPDELATLIEWLAEARDERGIVLVARSGAGKTVACRKAFFDCFHAPPAMDGQLDISRSRQTSALVDRGFGDTACRMLASREPLGDNVTDRGDLAVRLS
jgi:hypothetical protein